MPTIQPNIWIISTHDVRNALGRLLHYDAAQMHWQPLELAFEGALAVSTDHPETHVSDPWHTSDFVIMVAPDKCPQVENWNLLGFVEFVLLHTNGPCLVLQGKSLCENLLIIYDGSAESLRAIHQFNKLLPLQSKLKETTVLSTQNFGKKKIKQEKEFLLITGRKFPNLAYIKIPGSLDGLHLQQWINQQPYCVILNKQLAHNFIQQFSASPNNTNLLQTFRSVFWSS